MMKIRTYVVACIYGLIAIWGALQDWHLLINKLLGRVPMMGWGPRDQIILILGGCVLGTLLSVGWINLFRRRPWAWKITVGLLPIGASLTILDIFIAPAPPPGYASLCLLSVLLDQLVPLAFLLTDRPSSWSQAASPQSELPDPQ